MKGKHLNRDFRWTVEINCDCWNVRDNLRDILDSHTFENSRLWRLIMFLIMLD